MGCKAKKQNNPARLHDKSNFKFNFELEQIMTNELKAAQRDAERYRYWRNKYAEKFCDADLTPENFDRVTDAQMLMASANELKSALTQQVVAATQGVEAMSENWLPTPNNVNALPKPLRDYIHNLVANCDPSNTVRESMILKDCNAGLQIMYRKAANALQEVYGCFEMAHCEGLLEVLAQTPDEQLRDLVERRLMYALYAAQDALASQPPPSPAQTEAV